MAKLGRIEIADRDADFGSGAAFKLSKKPSGNRIVKLKSGWEVETQIGNPYVVARGKTTTDELSTSKLAYEVIQEGLDILCASGIDNLAVVDSSKEYFVWWRQGTEQFLKVLSIFHSAVSSGPDIEIVDLSITQTPSSISPTTVYHESLRYFRLSQVTNDFFDAFRNLWLALESLLAYKYPKQNSESEKSWLKRSLTELHNEVNFGDLFYGCGVDAIQSLLSNVYEDVRNGLFHAKGHRKRLVPQNAADRAKVADASKNLAKLIVLLFKRLLHVSRHTSWTPTNVHRAATRQFMVDCQFFLSDYNELSSNEGTFEDVTMIEDIPNKIRMVHHYSDEFSEPYLEQILAVADLSYLQTDSPLKSYFVCKEGKNDVFSWF